MKIVIFGANGATGKILTKQALDSGHTVTAVTRHPEAFPLRDVRLNVMGGDVFDLALVEQAVAGQDAVLSTLGVPFSHEPITIYSQGMAHIVQAMAHSGVRRVVCVSSSAAGTNHDTGAGFIFDKILQPIVMSTLGKTTYADMKQMETLLRESDVNWTVVRPSGLFETPAVTDYQVAEDHIRGQFTSRADLADCMLKQLATDQYSRKVLAVATFSVQPNMVRFMLQEAFKEPSKSWEKSTNVVKGQRSFGKRSHRGSDGPGVPESLSDLKLDWASHLAKTLSELDGVIQQHFIAASINKQRREPMDIRKQWGG